VTELFELRQPSQDSLPPGLPGWTSLAGCEGLREHALKARACVLAADARRRERDLEEAEAWFRRALQHLIGPPDCLERAFYCRHLALLRQDQGRLDEAVGLLWRAARIYRDYQEPAEQGLCLLHLGFLFLKEEQVERAVPPLEDACRALGWITLPEP
jgi:tetratricopeptide (TPR) repeat protein